MYLRSGQPFPAAALDVVPSSQIWVVHLFLEYQMRHAIPRCLNNCHYYSLGLGVTRNILVLRARGSPSFLVLDFTLTYLFLRPIALNSTP